MSKSKQDQKPKKDVNDAESNQVKTKTSVSSTKSKTPVKKADFENPKDDPA